MQLMKRMTSIILAAAMATAFSAPAFAEATPGEQAADTARKIEELSQSDWAANAEEARQEMVAMTEQITKDSSITITQEMTNAALSFFDIMENTKDDENFDRYVQANSENADFQVIYRVAENASELSINSAVLSDDGTITLDANTGATVSEYGYAVSFRLPNSVSATYYTVNMVGDNAQLISTTVPVTSYFDNDDGKYYKIVSFWVPHFTTYQLVPLTLNTGSGDSDNAQTDTSEDEQAASSADSTTAATVSENPIKATAVSMDLTLFAVVGAVAVAACGTGILVKKSRKGE